MAKKIDGNQNQIVKELRKLGMSVCIISNMGKGIPDILVGYKGKNYLFEIKDGNLPPSKKRLTVDEQEFHKSWRGQVRVIETSLQALEFIEVIR